ncbi:MAG: peptidoglycan-binding protein [Acidobacteriota bacterium]|nr:peptidoglycan-binding protein [Acidobacteriota bacterium]MDH3530878.1 peptidoglycan-binding protein [Acidobacteriota bacterium]
MKLSHYAAFVLAFFFLISTNTQLIAQTETTSGPKEAATRKKAFRPTKAQIQAAQEKLRSGGDYAGAVDGKYNNDFRSSLSSYQESNGLDKTGKLDEATILKLGIPLTDNQKGIETPSKPKRVVFRVSKEQITEAQAKLKSNGSFSGEADGKYSKEFRSAIRDYQSANGLKRKGSLNRATLEKMGIALTDQQKAIPVNEDDIASDPGAKRKRGPVFRATRDQISSVQAMLRSKGLYSGEDTGKLNPETRNAIKEWQGANGVKVTGTLNKTTLEAMGIELTERQKGS